MSHEIHFVTGKGGVGKSTLALAMAYKKSLQGLRVLLVEIGDNSFYANFLGEPGISYKPTSVKPSLDISLWSGEACLKEYALHLLKIESLYKLFFENPISKSLISVAPALSEIAIMGKITSGARGHGPKLPYDCVVIDAYATGHFMALISAPKSMSQTVKVGPMAQQNKEIDKILRNPQICHYHLVSLAEDLPVQETQELFAKLNKFLGFKASITLNKMIETSLVQADLKKFKKNSFVDFISHILVSQDRSVDRLKSLNGQLSTLPLVYEVSPWNLVQILSERLAYD